MIDYAQALQILHQAAVALPVERIPSALAAGRVLAADVISEVALPPFDNAAMDGFALCGGGGTIAAGTGFAVTGSQAAGEASQVAGHGAWEIMTGARVPDGLDAVVQVEKVEVLAEHAGRPTRIRLLDDVAPGCNLRRAGEDVAVGQLVIAAGQTLGVVEVTLLHALGVAQVPVVAPPQVALIATGSELVDDPARSLESGQIRDSNRPFLRGRLQAAGASVVLEGLVGDDVDAFHALLDQTLQQGAHLVISTGAVSMGRYDFIPDALRARGARIAFHKVAIRPGKPVLFAVLPEGALYFGLPGNPVSAAVGLRFFVEPVLRRMQGLPPEAPLQLPLRGTLKKPSDFRLHTRAQVRHDPHGRLYAEVLPQQESFRLMPMLQANAWVVVPAGVAEVGEGSRVDAYGLGHHQPIQLSVREH
ncbi:molybdopterin molybdotransferase MoeA [Stenotrophomonas sp. YIM B06876]|uniref:molybdopterin molybdotransferase MoeA n=1 Tax=Stenotrophomonas sp. YIM B06876 TaxID=3060211 RepID=UPI002738C40F|nr:molybdopterin molybdotransferase MoeA [Stenotrophomonas sp. YIM B06876]